MSATISTESGCAESCWKCAGAAAANPTTVGPAQATKTRCAALGGCEIALRHDTASSSGSDWENVSAETLSSKVSRQDRNWASPIAPESAEVAGRTEASATLPKISTRPSNHDRGCNGGLGASYRRQCASCCPQCRCQWLRCALWPRV